MTARMTRDMAVAIVSHSGDHPAPKLAEAAQVLLYHMRLQDTRIMLLEKALEDTGNELVRARIEACRVREPHPEPNEMRTARMLAAEDRQEEGAVMPFPSPQPLAKPPEKANATT